MPQPIDAARGLAAATFFGALLLAGPVHAAGSPEPTAVAQLAQTTPPAPPPGATPTKPPRRSRSERVEQRIKTLHDELQITAAQEPQWNAVAQAMRDHAQMVDQAVQQRQQNPSMTAVDDLKAYEGIVDANAQGMQKLVPAFETLYASLSDDQKKKADELFSHTRRHRTRAKKQP